MNILPNNQIEFQILSSNLTYIRILPLNIKDIYPCSGTPHWILKTCTTEHNSFSKYPFSGQTHLITQDTAYNIINHIRKIKNIQTFKTTSTYYR